MAVPPSPLKIPPVEADSITEMKDSSPTSSTASKDNDSKSSAMPTLRSISTQKGVSTSDKAESTDQAAAETSSTEKSDSSSTKQSAKPTKTTASSNSITRITASKPETSSTSESESSKDTATSSAKESDQSSAATNTSSDDQSKPTETSNDAAKSSFTDTPSSSSILSSGSISLPPAVITSFVTTTSIPSPASSTIPAPSTSPSPAPPSTGCAPGTDCSWKLGVGLSFGLTFILIVILFASKKYRNFLSKSNSGHKIDWAARNEPPAYEMFEEPSKPSQSTSQRAHSFATTSPSSSQPQPSHLQPRQDELFIPPSLVPGHNEDNPGRITRKALPIPTISRNF